MFFQSDHCPDTYTPKVESIMELSQLGSPQVAKHNGIWVLMGKEKGATERDRSWEDARRVCRALVTRRLACVQGTWELHAVSSSPILPGALPCGGRLPHEAGSLESSLLPAPVPLSEGAPSSAGEEETFLREGKPEFRFQGSEKRGEPSDMAWPPHWSPTMPHLQATTGSHS